MKTIETKNFGTLTAIDFNPNTLKTQKVGDTVAIAVFGLIYDEAIHLYTKVNDEEYSSKIIGYEGEKLTEEPRDNIEINYENPHGDESLYDWLWEIKERGMDKVIELTPELKARFDAI